MSSQCSLIINCSGNEKISENLIQCCLKMKSNYIHALPQIQLSNRMIAKYNEKALENNLYFIFSGYWEDVSLVLNLI